jgi:hypothetical protein
MSIKRWLRNWLLDDGSKQATAGNEISLSAVSSDDGFENYRNTLRFNVQPAHGGIILTIKKYDSKRDENNHVVHVIQDDQDVAQNIAHIVSMELLRS